MRHGGGHCEGREVETSRSSPRSISLFLRSHQLLHFGLPHVRWITDIAAVFDPSVDRKWLSPPLTAANEMAELWRELGLQYVEQTSFLIRMDYFYFDDFWTPFTRGEGPLGQLIASLSDNIRSALTEHLRNAYLSSRPDGPRSIPCVAWACRGTVPA